MPSSAYRWQRSPMRLGRFLYETFAPRYHATIGGISLRLCRNLVRRTERRAIRANSLSKARIGTTRPSHIQIFKFGTYYLHHAPEADLAAIIQGLKARHIALGMDGQMHIESERCGRGVESYGGRPAIPAIAERVKRLGGGSSRTGRLRPARTTSARTPLPSGSHAPGPSSARNGEQRRKHPRSPAPAAPRTIGSASGVLAPPSPRSLSASGRDQPSNAPAWDGAAPLAHSDGAHGRDMLQEDASAVAPRSGMRRVG